jgi:hypothetical protein
MQRLSQLRDGYTYRGAQALKTDGGHDPHHVRSNAKGTNLDYAIERNTGIDRQTGARLYRRDLGSVIFTEIEIHLYWVTVLITLTNKTGRTGNGEAESVGDVIPTHESVDG